MRLGTLFQSAMDKELRRRLGAHYTSERNVLKLIDLLFLEELRVEFEAARGSESSLRRFHQKLGALRFLDPACGCGDFLAVAFRELRRLELEVLRALYFDPSESADSCPVIRVSPDQFCGIELDKVAVRLAEVTLWRVEQQMNREVSAVFGQSPIRGGVGTTATLVNGNALSLDWSEICAASELTFVLGNPPFVGAKYQSDEQRADMRLVAEGIPGRGLLDYVAAWYLKAADFVRGTQAEVGFVSTNSITQGEQVGVLWPELFRRGMRINFAHRTFQWDSEARGKAAVHCVIVGFAEHDRSRKLLYEYADVRAEPHELIVTEISPYLVEGPPAVVTRRRRPLQDVPAIGIGNKPIDGGFYLFTRPEMEAFIEREPRSKRYFRRWMGAVEFLQGKERWCLWLGDCPPRQLRSMPACLDRVEKVRAFRKASKSAPTQKLADTPTRFHVENVPTTEYLVIPKVSSERREYVPIGYLGPEVLASDLVFIVGDATPFHFGVLSSSMHVAWLRAVGGRLKSDYRYSAAVVYNGFPWPEVDDRSRIEKAAASVLSVREQWPDSTYADLYDPRTMPRDLVEAHRKLDKAVDRAYRKQPFANERARVEFLLARYAELKSAL